MERFPADSSSFVLVAAELSRFPSANVLAVRFRRTEKNPQTDVVVLIVIFFVKWIFSLRRVVPTNEVHIVRRGKNTMVYGTPERGNAVQ